MQRHSSTGLLALSFASLVVPATAAFGATQTFDTAPADWVGSGNTADGNNFGFSNTNNTGGASPAGEAGGTFARSVGLHTYADTNLGGTLSLGGTTPLTISGEFDITANRAFDGAFGVGYFNTATPSPVLNPQGGNEVPNFIGMVFAEPNDGVNFRGLAQIRLSNGEVLNSQIVLSPQNVDRTFNLTFDPTTDTLSGDIAGTPVSVALNAGQQSTGATFDAFGLYASVGTNGVPSLQADAWFDNLSYTEVPEPAGLTLLAAAAGLLIAGRRRR